MRGKVALITGSATGIGKAVAIRLAQEGVRITANYSKSEKEALETQKEIEALGVQCLLVQTTVSNDQKVREMVQQTIDTFGRLDILVNNAGVTDFVKHEDLEGLKEEYWDRVMDVNVKGLFFCCRAAAPELKKQRGCIVNITSVAGLTGLGSSIAYAASKAAAISVTKSLARVMAPEVRVNSVAPGIVQTRWVEGQEDHVKRLAEGTPLGKVASPEDIANVVFSVIAHSHFVTGETIKVDGGMFI
ncbi:MULTISPECIES: SDR family oxidoreductase [unclassified Paenibacillus]|uniref:SDR family NAD(P)-dependent oxidoreductase n=1 Tax=unclassified Paenibacillus TaxID=185978 RepID=UPI001B5E6E0C|nr:MULTISPECIES: SDR family oxidoreductase [unclassified Paenibacillus]MBP1155830.1 3-oxoacyl-[acyl-carrier protein] reductase [Paenibacillus sp. PvP091]MBP1168784.1 3-oxoacyl-[acyl-carrier protein] reductase [Paenibacillus sp. PvR098]MBP2439812.1 3-oxoacyl-[acyl-carrier protein] reductase [Paenibacillus sp. PvP052]